MMSFARRLSAARPSSPLFSRGRAPLLGIGALLTALAGCASQERTCRAVDWSQLGYQDGAAFTVRGQETQSLANACPQFGVVFDPAAYEAGRRRGVQAFCAADMAEAGFAHAQIARPNQSDEIASQCQALGLTPDMRRYAAGYQGGVAEQCAADWGARGFDDALRGEDPVDVDAAAAFCRQAPGGGGGVGAYMRGYEAGLAQICQPSNAWRLGRYGYAEPNWTLCGPGALAELGAIYRDGWMTRREFRDFYPASRWGLWEPRWGFSYGLRWDDHDRRRRDRDRDRRRNDGAKTGDAPAAEG